MATRLGHGERRVPSLPAQRRCRWQYNIFKALERAEWDTLMFFYGVILCVGGLGTMGYLSLGSELMYGQLGPTTANILIGFLSAVVDNIPVMFAVLAMQPRYGPRPVDAGDADRRRRRLAAVGGFRRRRCRDGPGPRRLHLLFAPQVDLGDLCSATPPVSGRTSWSTPRRLPEQPGFDYLSRANGKLPTTDCAVLAVFA
jgi:hypothetical protein